MPGRLKTSIIGSAMDWLLYRRGSTRPLGLFRIILILLIWARLAEDLSLWNAVSAFQASISLAFFILTPLALIGWWTRPVMTMLAAVMALVYFHLGLNQGHAPFVHHHIYLLFFSTFICALGPCDKSFSLDAFLARRRKKEWSEQGSLTANHLFLLQLAAIYFWTAIDKSNSIFLSGVRLDQIFHFHYHGVSWAEFLLHPAIIVSASVSVVVIEYLLAIGVILRRHLLAIFFTGLLLHGFFYLLLPVQTFSLSMLTLYIFLPRPDLVHKWTDQVVADSGMGQAGSP